MQNEMRDRLVELIVDKENEIYATRMYPSDMDRIGSVADHLIANGVIVPPCKVGATVYLLEDYGYKKELKEKEIGVIVIKGTNGFSKELWEDVYGGVIGTFADLGKTVFLTKYQAEQKLKELSENG